MPLRDHVNPDGEVVSCRNNVIIAGCRRLFVHLLWMFIVAFDVSSRQPEVATDCYVYGCAEMAAQPINYLLTKDIIMPEGPEIRRAADNLEAAIKGKPLTEVWFAFAQLKPYESQLTGHIVTRIETRGKALLTHFSNGLTLYSHNQLYGVWRVIDTGEIPQTTRILRVRLQTADKTILLYSASDIEMLTAEHLTAHPFLQRVGPDVLDARLTPEEVKARLLSPRFRNRQFSGLLLDQAFLAGLGNYLRVEILWQVGLTGQHKAKDLSKAQLNALSHALLDIPRLSYATRGQVDENKHHGALFRFKVFHRDGEACERCGGIIEKTTLSSRPFYWCHHCQK